MEHYSATAVERAMKVHEVITRAMSGQSAWFQAADAGFPRNESDIDAAYE